jgi:hypothetical protein
VKWQFTLAELALCVIAVALALAFVFGWNGV